MIHLTDEILNEYLDNELAPDSRIQAGIHLAKCADCAARLATLKVLFTELDSLPEVTLTRSIAVPFIRSSRRLSGLPRSLRLTVTLQAAIAIVAFIITAPYVMKFLSPYLVAVQLPSFAEIFVQAQSQWFTWLDILSQFQFPTMPEIPVFDLSSLTLAFTLVCVSVLWLVGNGLLLRKKF